MSVIRLLRCAVAVLASSFLGESIQADESKALEPAPPKNPLPAHVLAWDALAKNTNVAGYADSVHFVFTVTNVSARAVTVQAVTTSCGCTTAQLPALPWAIPAAGTGQLSAAVRLVGKARKQTESVAIFTDQGFQALELQIKVLPPDQAPRPPAEAAHDREIAKGDRQAIFNGSCAACHLKPGEDKEGKALYYAVCAICHEGTNQVAATPDLFAIHTPTNVSFWIDGIGHGKPRSFMPAFSVNEGGPLSEMQIANLARFLNTADNMDTP